MYPEPTKEERDAQNPDASMEESANALEQSVIIKTMQEHPEEFKNFGGQRTQSCSIF